MAQTLYRNILAIIEEDVGMIYGPTGSGKSFLIEGIVQSAIEDEKKPVPIAFLDTERNFTGETMKWLKQKVAYQYIASFDGVRKWVGALNPGKKLVIIDSLGAPVLGAFAQSNLRQRGEMLLGGVDVLYNLKVYCQKNGAMAIITNQPVSEMGAKRDLRTGELLEDLDPFGGKWGHSVKEVYRCEKREAKGVDTNIDIFVHKSRHMPAGKRLASMRINSAGTTIEFEKYEGRRGKGRLPVRIVVAKGSAPETEEEPKPGEDQEPPEETGQETKETPEVPDEPDTTEATDSESEIQSTIAMMKALADEKGLPDDKLEGILFSSFQLASVADIKTLDQANAAMEAVRQYTGGDSE